MNTNSKNSASNFIQIQKVVEKYGLFSLDTRLTFVDVESVYSELGCHTFDTCGFRKILDTQNCIGLKMSLVSDGFVVQDMAVLDLLEVPKVLTFDNVENPFWNRPSRTQAKEFIPLITNYSELFAHELRWFLGPNGRTWLPIILRSHTLASCPTTSRVYVDLPVLCDGDTTFSVFRISLLVFDKIMAAHLAAPDKLLSVRRETGTSVPNTEVTIVEREPMEQCLQDARSDYVTYWTRGTEYLSQQTERPATSLLIDRLITLRN